MVVIMRKFNKFNRKSADYVAFIMFAYVFLLAVSIIGVVPFIVIISGSFTSEAYIVNHGYSILPKDFSTLAYTTLFENSSKLLSAYGVTIIVTVVGTLLSLFLSSMTAYVLQRKDFEWRNKFSFFIYFTTLFNGGLAPWYMLLIKMGFKNTLLAHIVPGLFSVFNILIIRNYMNGIPGEITESAKIDGANDFKIFVQLIMPLSKPVLATIALFTGLAYWNDWRNSMLFISKDNLCSLQYYLYTMLNNATAVKELLMGTSSDLSSNVEIPGESLKLAMTVVATGPILLLYPFIQKYFVKGIVMGAVKG